MPQGPDLSWLCWLRKEKEMTLNGAIKGLENFHRYVYDFYGLGGIYDMRATHADIEKATAIYLFACATEGGPEWGDGDSLDRERVRDILIEKLGYIFPEKGEEAA
jgi:hypothetical protein